MSMIRNILLIFGLCFATAARAEWIEATSRNFIVYSEGSEAEAREFAAKLERFNFVLRAYHNVTAPPAANKLRVFLLPSIRAVGQMAGRDGVAGFYVPWARGRMMVGTRARASGSGRVGQLDSESILLHEYTHHFMYQYFPATYPTWYSEGFAEFWGATDFLPNDVVEVGMPAEHRFGSLNPNLGSGNMSRWLTVGQLLSAQSYADVTELDLLYAEGWLLVRYTFDNVERRRQLREYLRLVNAGSPYADAARAAFGDLGRLNSELYDYAHRGRFDVVRLPFRTIEIGDISVRRPGPAEQALMEREIKLGQGIGQREASAFADEVRTIAARFPQDSFALGVLMESERLARNNDAALAAADRLLAVEPNNARALVTKGLIQVEGLQAASSTDQAAWNAARQLFVRASRLARNDPIVLEAYYDSFTAQGLLPPEGAQNAIYTAMELAPSDPNLRYKVALDFERRDMIADAIAIIRPEANRVPHRRDESERERQRRETLEERYRRAGTTRRETAREMLARLEARLAQQRPAAPAANPPPGS